MPEPKGNAVAIICDGPVLKHKGLMREQHEGVAMNGFPGKFTL